MNNIGIPQASTIASDVDSAFMFITYVSIIIFIGASFFSIYFSWKYRQINNESKFTSPIDHNNKLELIWTIIPTILLVVIFFWGFKSYILMKTIPSDAMEIKVTGRKWFWTYQYPNGASVPNAFVVPEGKPIKILLTSTDVIHSFYVPQFRVKMDAVPNRYTSITFTATKQGVYDVFCAEYCGTSHSGMIGKVEVKSEEDYKVWLEKAADAGSGDPSEVGKKVYSSNGCAACHSIDGVAGVGPSWKGMFGKDRELASGGKVMGDENYIKKSILNPGADIVKGFQGVMPSYQGVLNDKQIDAVISYIKTLK